MNPFPCSATKGRALVKAHGWNTSVFPAACNATNCGTAPFPIAKGAVASVGLLFPRTARP